MNWGRGVGVGWVGSCLRRNDEMGAQECGGGAGMMADGRGWWEGAAGWWEREV